MNREIIITKDGSMKWETTHTKYDVNNNNVMHTNNNYDSTYRKPLQTKNLFSALIRGILQMVDGEKENKNMDPNNDSKLLN